MSVRLPMSAAPVATAAPAELGMVGVRHASALWSGRDDSAAARWVCATRAKSASLLSSGGFCNGTMKGSMLAVRCDSASAQLTDRADPHMRVHGCGLVDFESAKDVTGDQVVDMPNVICG